MSPEVCLFEQKSPSPETPENNLETDSEGGGLSYNPVGHLAKSIESAVGGLSTSVKSKLVLQELGALTSYTCLVVINLSLNTLD